ncbi:SRPBCC family protein [Rubellimicrobium sp. CFH 75288]|uniref:SRPBCC family protein n=1 Tax=Rubellimicrobium sp. CFH 75288 TaxID=2697034 RepID=UPI00141286A4|nr:SRPBCC family protein [Rubellimicrobium sp. CFH 75288]NAZ35271.1 cyclase [Rubellimicrobium sp. CFH 75288]
MDQPHPTPRWTADGRVLATAAAALGLGALAGLAAYGVLAPSPRAPEPRRIPDDAPGRTARQARFGDFAVTGRSVTINRPREEVFAFWRHFPNLSQFMENIESVREEPGGLGIWTIRAPLGMTVEVRTRIVNERPGEQIAWRSTPDSDVETEGKVSFRDAPGGRGTIVAALVAWKPPFGALGQTVARLFAAEPSVQSRRDLKRLKMLLETGEIATNRNRKA